MSLQSQIRSALLSAAKSLPDAFIDSTVYDKSPSAYDVATATKTFTERSSAVKVVIDRFKEDEIDGKIVKNFDVKLTVVPTNNSGFEFDFSSVDRIVVGSQNYSIVVSIPQLVGSAVVAYLMHVRPQGTV